MLKQALELRYDGMEIELTGPNAVDALAHVKACANTPDAWDLVHVNHHAALHSSWTGLHIREIQERFCPVVVTHHDTFETLRILVDRGYKFFIGAADHIVVHEPIEGLPVDGPWTYLRQPIPSAPIRSMAQPPLTVGSVGFDFPWKNFKLLRTLANKAGWRTDIFGGMDWYERDAAIARLAGCRATAFLYQTGNSGTSAAIRMGLAARKPVVAFPCRQFRDLYESKYPDVRGAVLWAHSEDEFLTLLNYLASDQGYWLAACDRVQRLAEHDSWANGARVYYNIYRNAITEYAA